MPENGREITLHIPKMAQFLKGGKNGHFAKAIAKQNGHKWPILGLSIKITKHNKTQKLPFKTIRVVLRRKLLKNTLNIRKMTRR